MDIFNALPDPVRANLIMYLKTGCCILITLAIAALIFRFIFGKRSAKNHAISSVFSILFMYVATIVVLVFWSDYQGYLAPLPFVTISGNQLILFSLKDAGFTAVCSEILKLIVLSFLVNLIDQFIREGRTLFRWLIQRILTVVLAMAGNLALTYLAHTYIPEVYLTYSPAILIGVLFTMFILGGIAKVIIGATLAMANPIIGAFYTFFFATLVGRQLSKAVLTAAILTALVYALNTLEIAAFTISAAALSAYLPFLAIVLGAWYLLGIVT